MSGYAALIAKATKITDPAALVEIEYEMRANLSGLDHLDRRAFNKLARLSAQTCAAMGMIRLCDWAAELAGAVADVDAIVARATA